MSIDIEGVLPHLLICKPSLPTPELAEVFRLVPLRVRVFSPPKVRVFSPPKVRVFSPPKVRVFSPPDGAFDLLSDSIRRR